MVGQTNTALDTDADRERIEAYTDGVFAIMWSHFHFSILQSRWKNPGLHNSKELAVRSK